MEREWLIDLRKKKGLTQGEVAARSGISQPSYFEIEKGKTTPKIRTAQAVARVLGFSWTAFYDDLPGPDGEESGVDDEAVD